MKLKTLLSLLLICTLALSGCGKQTNNEPGSTQENHTNIPNAQNEEENSENQVEKDNSDSQTETANPKVQIEMDDGGKVLLELYPEYAPKTVDNFIKLVSEGFYDGLTFHRIVDDFMAQGGDPEGDGTGGSSENIEGEFSENGFTQNTLSHTEGVISMARGENPNTASSQFFIMLSGTYSSALDGKYAAFGKVIEGMDIITDFQNLEREYNSMFELAIPVEPLIMKKVSIVD